jgi:intracellular septation protein
MAGAKERQQVTEHSQTRSPDPQFDRNQLLKMALEIGPLAVFFLVNGYRGIFWGTGFFMVATVLALVASRLLLGRIPIMPLVSGVFVIVFGSLTLFLNDSLFIKMKPTIVNSLFALILLGALAWDRPLLKSVIGDVFQLTDRGWAVLTLRWAIFFAFLAVLNEVVWRNFSESFWISFKIWGIIPLTMIFAAAQVGVLKRYESH